MNSLKKSYFIYQRKDILSIKENFNLKILLIGKYKISVPLILLNKVKVSQINFLK